MNKSEPATKASRFMLLGSVCVVVAALYFAREVLVPIALSILLSFLLAPLVQRLERLKLPRGLAVVLVVLFSFAILGGIGYVVYNQGIDLKDQQAKYSSNVKEKIAKLPLLSWMRNARAQIKQLSNTPTSKPTTATATPAAIPVYMVNATQSTADDSAPLDMVSTIGSAILGPVGTAFIVIVFTIFMLLQREDLRDRMIRLVGRERLTTTTQALDDAAERVSRYLLMQSIVNGSVGLTVTVALWMVGKMTGTPFPSPALWGLLAALLRFIPYVGIWVAAAPAILLSLAVFATAKTALITLIVYLGIELIAGNVVEPLLFGASTGIATLAVLVAAAFWTWLWGPVGLLLSTPLTVCLVVMGKYVPQLEFLAVLLAEEPALEPPDRVYQRLLALDQEEAMELVNEYARKMPLEELYDTVLCPALAMAEQDQHRGNLDEDRHHFILNGIRDIIDELGDQHRTAEIRADAQSQVDQARGEKPASTPPARGSLATPAEGSRVMLPKGCTVNIVCLPAADDADEIAAMMLGQLLEMRGYCVVLVSVTQLASEMVATVEKTKADLVCVSALPPAAVTHARYLCKRLHGKLPNIEMVVGLWGTPGDLKRAKERIACVHTVQMASHFRQAVDQVHQMIQPKLLQREPANDEPATL